MANVLEIAWLAGLLEGDGSFQMHKSAPGYRVPLIKVSMLDRDIIERVAKVLESNITKSLTPKKDKVMYTSASARKKIIEPLLKAIYPYMGIRRKEQIDKMLNHYKLQESVSRQT